MRQFTIKKALINYRKNREEIEDIEFKIVELENEVFNIKSNGFPKIPDGESCDRQKLLIKRFEAIDELKKERDHMQYEINQVNRLLDLLDGDFKNLIMDRFIKEDTRYMTLDELSLKYCYSKRSIYRIIDDSIEMGKTLWFD